MGPRWKSRVEDAVEQIALGCLKKPYGNLLLYQLHTHIEGDITADSNEIQKKLQEQSTKLKNQIEVDTLLDTYDTPKLNQKETGYLNSSISSNAIEAVILKKKLPTIKIPRPDGFTIEFYQNFRVLTLIVLNLYHEIEKEGRPPNALESQHFSLPKPNEDMTKNKYYRLISLLNED